MCLVCECWIRLVANWIVLRLLSWDKTIVKLVWIVVGLTMGLKVSTKLKPTTWWYPLATNLAL